MKRSSGLIASILVAAILAVLLTCRPLTLSAQTTAPALAPVGAGAQRRSP